MHRVGVEVHEIFGSLSDPTRIRIMRLLLETKEEVCLCELSDSLDEPEYKLSRHLKILKSVGLITAIRDGKWVYHGLIKDTPYFKNLYKALLSFPDDSRLTIKDFNRFKKRMSLRQDGRCKTGTQRIDEKSVR